MYASERVHVLPFVNVNILFVNRILIHRYLSFVNSQAVQTPFRSYLQDMLSLVSTSLEFRFKDKTCVCLRLYFCMWSFVNSLIDHCYSIRLPFGVQNVFSLFLFFFFWPLTWIIKIWNGSTVALLFDFFFSAKDLYHFEGLSLPFSVNALGGWPHVALVSHKCKCDFICETGIRF